VDDEIRAYKESIERRLVEICDVLDRLPPSDLNFRPDIVGANSPWMLATHTLGNARAWVLGIACSQPMRRDRPAEFAGIGDSAAEFRGETTAFFGLMEEALARLSSEDLNHRTKPSRELWGEGEPREISAREALLQVVEHASLHLGHLHVTRDLALARP